jgi:hypothetical protein
MDMQTAETASWSVAGSFLFVDSQIMAGCEQAGVSG